MLPYVHPRFTPLHDDAYCNASKASAILGVLGAFTAAALVTVILRIYVRTKMLKFTGPDDYVMVAALFMAIGTFTCFVAEVVYGIGHHLSCISVPDHEMMSKWTFYHSLWVMFGVVLVKISIAFFLMRLAPRNAWKRSLWGAIIFLVCFSLACAGTLIFSCVPIAASWNQALALDPKTKCFSLKTFEHIGVFNSVINIVTDFLFALLPIPIIVKLHVNLRTKLALAFILGLGLIACAAGIVKAHLQANYTKDPDPTWHDAFNMWNMLELCLGILAASLPSLKPLFSHILQTSRTKLGMSSASRSREKKNGTPGTGPYASLSQQSAKYRRTYDPRDIHDILADVDLEEFKQGGVATTVETRAGKDFTPAVPALARMESGRLAYSTRIVGRDMPREDSSWEDVPAHSRHDSEERLHQPHGIYRTLEISRTFEVLKQ